MSVTLVVALQLPCMKQTNKQTATTTTTSITNIGSTLYLHQTEGSNRLWYFLLIRSKAIAVKGQSVAAPVGK